MYKKYNKEIISRARNRRKEGLSLSEISNIMKIPKGTIGNWVRDIDLTEKQKQRLNKKEEGSWEKIKIYSLTRRKRTVKKHKEWYLYGKNIILNEESLVGLILYAAEGTHSKKSSSIDIANTTLSYLLKFIEMMEHVFDIKRSEIVGRVAIHSYHDKEKVIKYWTKKLDIKKISIMEVRNGKRRIRKGYMGTMHLIYSNIEIRCKLEGLIDKYTGRKFPIGQGLV